MNQLPKIVTFDGEARSGKGTIVQFTKDYIRDTLHKKVMLIDLGQVFRVLVVEIQRAEVDINDPDAIDAYLSDEASAEHAVQFVKEVYHMSKDERDAILYTNEVSADSAKVGARALSQEFKDSLLRKWMQDARTEGFEVVLLDGRALEETGDMLVSHGLCEFVLGLYFVCNPIVGARRTLGYAHAPYDELDSEQQAAVDLLVEQINERNDKDRVRAVQPVVPPAGAPVWNLPDNAPAASPSTARPMYVVDTSAEMPKDAMSLPVATRVGESLD